MLNVAVLMGRLTADPELRQTPSGISVTSFTLACDRSYAKAGTERQTDFIDIVAWRSTAEFICKYFRKGQLMAVQGSMQTRTYTDREGNKRKAFEIVADNAHFAEPKRSGSSAGSGPAAAPAAKTANKDVQPEQAEKQPASAYSSGDTKDFQEIPSDDDLPF